MHKLIATLILTLILSATVSAQDWQIVDAPLYANITGISFVHPDTGFIVSSGGKFARTYDGGNSWQSSTIQNGIQIEDLSFINSQTGVVCGRLGSVFMTSDGGTTFKQISPGDTTHMYIDVHMFDKKNIMITGLDTDNNPPFVGVALRTESGGSTWQPLDVNGLGFSEIFHSADGQTLFPAFGRIFRSNDEGKTWRQTPGVSEGQARSVSFSGKTGAMVGPRGFCMISSDSGRTWGQRPQDKTQQLISVRVIGENEIFIGGMGSVMLHSTDGGNTWQKELLAKFFDIFDLEESGDKIWAVGSDGTVMYKLLR